MNISHRALRSMQPMVVDFVKERAQEMRTQADFTTSEEAENIRFIANTMVSSVETAEKALETHTILGALMKQSPDGSKMQKQIAHLITNQKDILNINGKTLIESGRHYSQQYMPGGANSCLYPRNTADASNTTVSDTSSINATPTISKPAALTGPSQPCTEAIIASLPPTKHTNPLYLHKKHSYDRRKTIALHTPASVAQSLYDKLLGGTGLISLTMECPSDDCDDRSDNDATISDFESLIEIVEFENDDCINSNNSDNPTFDFSFLLDEIVANSGLPKLPSLEDLEEFKMDSLATTSIPLLISHDSVSSEDIQSQSTVDSNRETVEIDIVALRKKLLKTIIVATHFVFAAKIYFLSENTSDNEAASEDTTNQTTPTPMPVSTDGLSNEN